MVKYQTTKSWVFMNGLDSHGIVVLMCVQRKSNLKHIKIHLKNLTNSSLHPPTVVYFSNTTQPTELGTHVTGTYVTGLRWRLIPYLKRPGLRGFHSNVCRPLACSKQCIRGSQSLRSSECFELYLQSMFSIKVRRFNYKPNHSQTCVPNSIFFTTSVLSRFVLCFFFFGFSFYPVWLDLFCLQMCRWLWVIVGECGRCSLCVCEVS